MAVTKIIPIRTTLQNSVDYICNPSKTDDRLLVHSEHCFPNTAGLEFEHYLRQAQAGGNTIGRHLIQSFAPGEVSPEQAHEIGKKLAAEILKGEYAFVLATHVDRGHVHNHFVWCAANIVTHKKYRSNKNSYHEIRDISDKLCKENELSVIVPQADKTYGKSYDSYKPGQTSGSWRDKLKTAIDNLTPEAKDFEDLLKLMEAQGYKIKRGKHISFCAPGQERFTRAKSIGEGYTEEEITRRILEKPKRRIEEAAPPTVTPPISQTPPPDKPKTIRKKIDIDANQKFAMNPGLERWAKIQNLQNTARAFIAMQELGGMDAFMKLYNECRTDVATITNGIEANNGRIKAWGDLRGDIAKYRRTLPVYREYRSMKKAKGNITFFGRDKAEEFRKENEADITLHESMRENLRDYERPLYSAATINTEIEKIKTANVNNNKALAHKKAELKHFANIHTYLQHLQREHEPPPPQKEHQQKKRSKGFDR